MAWCAAFVSGGARGFEMSTCLILYCSPHENVFFGVERSRLGVRKAARIRKLSMLFAVFVPSGRRGVKGGQDGPRVYAEQGF